MSDDRGEPAVIAAVGGLVDETRLTLAIHGPDLQPDEIRLRPDPDAKHIVAPPGGRVDDPGYLRDAALALGAHLCLYLATHALCR